MSQIYSKWDIVSINPLTLSEIEAFIEGKLGNEDIQSLLNSPEYLPVISSPLMLNSILNAAEKEGVKGDYIQTQVASYMGWRGQTKSLLPANVSPKLLDQTLEAIAVDSVLNELVWFDVSNVESILLREYDGDSAVLLEAIINLDPFQVDGDRIRFRHKSYQTAFCARYLLNKLNDLESFLITVETVFSKSNGKLVIEDMFLEASNDLRVLILSISPKSIVEHINIALPKIVNSVILDQGSDSGTSANILSLIKTTKSALERNDKRRRDIVVFAIHGFNTRGEWKNRVAAILGQETDGERYIFHPWDYGDFKLSILNPFSRRKKVKEFQDFYNQTLDMYDVKPEICVIAHSFGSFILGNSIKRFPEIYFHRIILLGAYFGAFRSVISGLSDHPFRF